MSSRYKLCTQISSFAGVCLVPLGENIGWINLKSVDRLSLGLCVDFICRGKCLWAFLRILCRNVPKMETYSCADNVLQRRIRACELGHRWPSVPPQRHSTMKLQSCLHGPAAVRCLCIRVSCHSSGCRLEQSWTVPPLFPPSLKPVVD